MSILDFKVRMDPIACVLCGLCALSPPCDGFPNFRFTCQTWLNSYIGIAFRLHSDLQQNVTILIVFSLHTSQIMMRKNVSKTSQAQAVFRLSLNHLSRQWKQETLLLKFLKMSWEVLKSWSSIGLSSSQSSYGPPQGLCPWWSEQERGFKLRRITVHSRLLLYKQTTETICLRF